MAFECRQLTPAQLEYLTSRALYQFTLWTLRLLFGGMAVGALLSVAGLAGVPDSLVGTLPEGVFCMTFVMAMLATVASMILAREMGKLLGATRYRDDVAISRAVQLALFKHAIRWRRGG
ncbi:MAG TPA: hypothetical protein VFB84_02795 [Micromonosporaceae bacterium]|nr:hypothetical protein [Micromonosporaceae bacterium]